MKSLLLQVSLPFAVVFFLLAGFFLAMGIQQDKHAQALIGDSLFAVARLTDKTSFTSSGIHKEAGFGDKGPTTYTLHYSFIHPETGAAFAGKSNVDHAVWEAVTVGNHYEILFSRANPAITSLFSGREFVEGAKLAYRMAIFFGACAAICAVFGFGARV